MINRAVVLTTIILVAVSLSPAFALDCPKFPEQAKKDWEVKVSAEVAKIGPLKGADLRTTTRSVTRDLFANLPDAGRVYLEQMMFAAYCSALRDDKELKESEKSKRLHYYISEVRGTITAQGTAKPVGKKSPPKKTLKTVGKKPLPKKKPKDPFNKTEEHANNIYTYLNEEQIRKEIDKSLNSKDIEKAICIIKESSISAEKKKEEYQRICNYCIKNKRLEEAVIIANLLPKAEKDELMEKISLEQVKIKK